MRRDAKKSTNGKKKNKNSVNTRNKGLKSNIKLDNIDSVNIENVIETIEKIKNNEIIKQNDYFCNEFQNILDRLRDRTFRLSVVGGFSSGKSTFLNALIGKDVLKHGVKETTATITEIENDVTRKGNTVFDVYYQNGKIETDIPIDSLTDYTTTVSKQYKVAEEIEKVVIKSNVIDVEYPISFVDTPGLNGVADGHREKTIDQIKKSHACVYLMQLRGLSENDIEFLKIIGKYQHNIIFIQNFIDELKEHEGESVEEKINAQRKIIEERVFDKESGVSFEIVGVSAVKALVSKDKDIIEYGEEELTDEVRENLYEESNFEQAIKAISRLMASNKRGQIQKRASIQAAQTIIEQLNSIVSIRIEQEEEQNLKSPDERIRQGYEKVIESLKNSKEKNKKDISNFIIAESSDIKKKIKEDTKQQLSTLKSDIEEELISKSSSIEEFEKYYKNELSTQVNGGVGEIEDSERGYINILLENLYSAATLKVTKFVGGKENKINKEFEINKDSENDEKEKFKIEEKDKIEENKLITAKAKYKRELLNATNNENKCKTILNEIELVKKEKNMLTDNKNKAIWNLGNKPEAERKYREETYYEYRGGIGFLDAILGPKEATRTVEYYDNSKQDEWLRKKADIENSYIIEQNKFNTEIRNLEEYLRQCEEEVKNFKKYEERYRKNIESQERLLNARRESIKEQREKAKTEYLRAKKKNVMKDIENYLNNIENELIENLGKLINKGISKISEMILRVFDESYKARIKSLEELKNKSDSKTTKNTELHVILENANKVIKNYLGK